MSRPEKYMLSALKLARKGLGRVEPNPVVGCIIVKDDNIIGQGWHEEFGAAHAEINALGDCVNNGNDAAGATMYVTLEPCCHHGKTGPCTQVIINAKISKVVVAVADPSEHCGGKGIEQLRKSGIEVEVGLCGQPAALLNAGFFKFTRTAMPWVILKWAQSSDGKCAYADTAENGQWISNELSRKQVHKLRRSVQGILTGINTVLDDDPLLTPRPAKGRTPKRIVLDSSLKIPLDCKLLRTIDKSPVVVFTTAKAIEKQAAKVEEIKRKGAEVIEVSAKGKGCDLEEVLVKLSEQGAQKILVEAGPTLITSFLQQGLADEVYIYIAPMALGAEGDIDVSRAMAKLVSGKGFYTMDKMQFHDDVCINGFLKPV